MIRLTVTPGSLYVEDRRADNVRVSNVALPHDPARDSLWMKRKCMAANRYTYEVITSVKVALWRSVGVVLWHAILSNSETISGVIDVSVFLE